MTIAKKLTPFYLAEEINKTPLPDPLIQEHLNDLLRKRLEKLKTEPFGEVLGLSFFGIDPLVDPFNLWAERGGILYLLENQPPEEKERFKAKIATHLIYLMIGEISQTEIIELDYLSRLLVLIQVISTNLRHSYLFPRYQKKIPLSIIRLTSKLSSCYYLAGGKTNLELEKKLWVIARKIMGNHFYAIDTKEETGLPVFPLLAEAFLELISYQEFQFEDWWQKKIKEDSQKISALVYEGLPYAYQIFEEEINQEKTCNLVFPLFYILGLLEVAKKVEEGKHNGVLYLFDHIKQVMESRTLWPDNPSELTKEEWKKRLLSCLKPQNGYPLLFDFLIPFSLVREVIGRYDYRGLIYFLKKLGLIRPTVVALGFGQVGAATWEMEKILRENGIEVKKTVAIDILPLSPIPPEDTKNYSVVAFDRLPCGIIHTINSEQPKLNQLSPQQILEILKWRKKIILKGEIDLTVPLNEKDIIKGEIVTLQGTVGCVADLEKRKEMIKNALRMVKKGGIVIIEGGMSLYGGQNVSSIALRNNGDQFEILYINISRSRKEPKGSFLPKNHTLILNSDYTTHNGEVTKLPEYINAEWASFSDPYQILPILYNAIRS